MPDFYSDRSSEDFEQVFEVFWIPILQNRSRVKTLNHARTSTSTAPIFLQLQKELTHCLAYPYLPFICQWNLSAMTEEEFTHLVVYPFLLLIKYPERSLEKNEKGHCLLKQFHRWMSYGVKPYQLLHGLPLSTLAISHIFQGKKQIEREGGREIEIETHIVLQI